MPSDQGVAGHVHAKVIALERHLPGLDRKIRIGNIHA